MVSKKKHRDEYKAHVIVLPSYCPVAICLTRSMAFELAVHMYGDLKQTQVQVRPATDRDWEVLR